MISHLKKDFFFKPNFDKLRKLVATSKAKDSGYSTSSKPLMQNSFSFSEKPTQMKGSNIRFQQKKRDMSTASEPYTEKGGHDFRSHLISGPGSRGFQVRVHYGKRKRNLKYTHFFPQFKKKDFYVS